MDNLLSIITFIPAVAALVLALFRGVPGATYCLGPRQERSNLDVVRAICATLDRLRPDPAGPRERVCAGRAGEATGRRLSRRSAARRARAAGAWPPR